MSKKGMDKKVVETPYTDIYVTVRTTRSADGSTCRIAAIASDCRGKGLPGAKQRVQKLNSASERQDIERATAFVIARALDAYIQAYPQQQAPALSENIAADTLLSLYQQFHEAGYPVHPDWRPGTNHSAKLAFKRTIPHICAALADGCDPQNLAVAIHDRVRDDVQSNANARDRSSIDKTVRKNMLWCDAVLNAMRLAYPGRPELEIRLNVPDGHGLSVLREQAKALPQNVREALAEYLTDCCRLYDARLALTSPDCANPEELRHQIQTLEKVISDENPRYVLVMLMMYDAGLRTSEAAAVTGDSLRLLNCAGHHATSLVLVQCQARDGKRCRILKSENAYRTTVLSHWGHVMVQSVLRYLAVFDSQWPQQVTDPKGASAWILQRLRVLGVSDCCLSNTAASLMAAGEHGLLASEDLSAYILRRDCATRWAFRCGLSLDTIDILLGHARYRHRGIHQPLCPQHPGPAGAGGPAGRKGGAFVSQKEAIDTATPTGKFMLTVFGAVAELEREYILQRQREGIEIAKAQGKYTGRKPIFSPDFDRVAAQWRRGELTAVQAMKRLNMSKATFYRKVRYSASFHREK